jgi:hypothetical protein
MNLGNSDKLIIKRLEDIEKFLKKLTKEKEFWCREVLIFL